MNCETISAYGLAIAGAAEGVARYCVKPLTHEIRPATKAWAMLLVSVVAYDLLCPSGETLSEGVDVMLARHPVATASAIGITSLHLMNMLPETVDPWHRALKLVKS